MTMFKKSIQNGLLAYLIQHLQSKEEINKIVSCLTQQDRDQVVSSNEHSNFI